MDESQIKRRLRNLESQVSLLRAMSSSNPSKYVIELQKEFTIWKGDLEKLTKEMAQVSKLTTQKENMMNVFSDIKYSTMAEDGPREAPSYWNALDNVSEQLPFAQFGGEWGVLLPPQTKNYSIKFIRTEWREDQDPFACFGWDGEMFEDSIQYVPKRNFNEDAYEWNQQTNRSAKLANASMEVYTNADGSQVTFKVDTGSMQNVTIESGAFNLIRVTQRPPTEEKGPAKGIELVFRISTFKYEYGDDDNLTPTMSVDSRLVPMELERWYWPDGVTWKLEAPVKYEGMFLDPLIGCQGGFTWSTLSDGTQIISASLEGLYFDFKYIVTSALYEASYAVYEKELAGITEDITMETDIGMTLSAQSQAILKVSQTTARLRIFEMDSIPEGAIVSYRRPEGCSRVMKSNRTINVFGKGKWLGNDSFTLVIGEHPDVWTAGTENGLLSFSLTTDIEPFEEVYDIGLEMGGSSESPQASWVDILKGVQGGTRRTGRVYAHVQLSQDQWVGSNGAAEDSIIVLNIEGVDTEFASDPNVYNESGTIVWEWKIPIGTCEIDSGFIIQPQRVWDGKGPNRTNWSKTLQGMEFVSELVNDRSEVQITTSGTGPGYTTSVQFLDYQPQFKIEKVGLVKIKGKFKVLQDPIGSAAEFKNIYDEFQDAAINDLAYNASELQKQVENLSTRVEVLEGMFKNSIFKFLGSVLTSAASFMPPCKAMVVFILAGAAITNAGELLSGHVYAFVESMVTTTVSLLGINFHTTNKVTEEDGKHIDELKLFVKNATEKVRPMVKEVDGWVLNGLAKLKKLDPKGLFTRGQVKGNLIPMHSMNANHTTLVSSELQMWNSSKWLDHADKKTVKGAIYRALEKHNKAPSHMATYINQKWEVLEPDTLSPIQVGVSVRAGVGEGIGAEMGVSRTTTKIVGGGDTGLGNTQFWYKMAEGGVKEPFFLDPKDPNVTEEMLRAEAVYYYKVGMGSVANMASWVERKPWNNSQGRQLYEQAWRSMERESTYQIQKVVNNSCVATNYRPQQIAAIGTLFGEDRQRGDGFTYDLLSNNCQHVAKAIHAIGTGRQVPGQTYKLEVYKRQYMLDFQVRMRENGIPNPNSPIAMKEVYDAMNAYYRSMYKTIPRVVLDHEDIHSESVGSALFQSPEVVLLRKLNFETV